MPELERRILYELGVILELKRVQPSDLILLQTTNPFKTSSRLQKHHSHFLVELEVCIPLGVKSSNYFNQIQLFVGLKPNCWFWLDAWNSTGWNFLLILLGVWLCQLLVSLGQYVTQVDSYIFSSYHISVCTAVCIASGVAKHCSVCKPVSRFKLIRSLFISKLCTNLSL